MAEHTAADIADLVDARLEGDGEHVLTGVASLDEAGTADLAFLERESLIGRLTGPGPGALLARDGVTLPPTEGVILRVDHPEAAFAKAVPLFFPEPETSPGVHPTAIVGTGARIGADVTIGPWSVVGNGAEIGDGTVLGPSTHIARGAVVGANCRLGHGVSVLSAARLGDGVIVHEGARIGSEGFGYAATTSGAVKIPQVGLCVIGDDVEIGANCTIDRGALGDTTIGARTKLDNLVQVGHNVTVGEDCMIVAQVGIAGSATIGAGTSVGGQAGIGGHCEIGPGARIAAQAGVIGNVPAGATYSGYPARPHRTALRASAAALKVSEALSRLSKIEKRLDGEDGEPR